MVKFKNTNGVEISSWIVNGNEIIYQKNGSWNKQDPFLFPNIGISAKSWKYDGIETRHTKHGIFVGNDKLFTKINENTFEYIHVKNERFNYNFKVNKSYLEKNNELLVNVSVENLDTVKIPMQLGFHLAVQINNDTIIDFKRDNVKFNNIDLEKGFVTENTSELKLKNNRLKIDFDLFKKNDSLVFANNQINVIEVENKNYNLRYTLLENLNALTIWTNSLKSDKHKFLCIEPWSDICTTNKEDHILFLEKNQIKNFSYKIEYIEKHN